MFYNSINKTFSISNVWGIGRDITMKLVQAISQRVEELLKQKGYTLYQLEKEGGVPRSTVSDVILVKKKRVSTDTIYQICATLGITLKEFFDAPVFDEVTD